METAQEDRRRMQVRLSLAGGRYVIEKRRFVEQYFDMLLDAISKKNVLEFQRLVQLTAEKMEGISK